MNTIIEKAQTGISRMRKMYKLRFLLRLVILAAAVALYFLYPACFGVLHGWNFFRSFSLLHILWGIWVLDMLFQLIPTSGYLSLGSTKLFKMNFRPMLRKFKISELHEFMKKSTKDALQILLVWILLGTGISILYFTQVADAGMLLLISVLFFVFDLICVLFWCPFRVWFMKNRCCTTCRIFNWDHLMMFTPLLFIRGFYGISLCLMSVSVFIAWELCFFLHPERFWENSNEALKCSQCTDKLCGKRNCSY